MKIEDKIQEENKSKIVFSVTNGIIDSPYTFNEDEYYYRLIASNGSYRLVPVQVVGGLVQELKKVDGKVGEALQNIGPIYSIKHGIVDPAIRELLEEQDIVYKEDTYLKYIETAKQYAKLRERLLYEILTRRTNSLLYQGDRALLPSTKAAFSLGYNEDSYIKSSIAYEIEMYMRSVFSKYGVLDPDLRDIFNRHNIKEAFLKFPRTVREETFKTYKELYERKAISKNKKLIEEILNPTKIEKILRYHETTKDMPTEEIVDILKQYYEILTNQHNLNDKEKEIIYRIRDLLYYTKEKDKKINEFSRENGKYKLNKEILTEKDIEDSLKDSKFSLIHRNNKYSDSKLDYYLEYTKTYKEYKLLDVKYQSLINYLLHINQEINSIQIKIKEIEIELKKQDNIFKKTGSYRISKQEYERLKFDKTFLEKRLDSCNKHKSSVSHKIEVIEDKMANFIFDDELKMETAYQDNRYTYENLANNNYDNLMLFLNALKQVVTKEKTPDFDYDSLYRDITIHQKDKKRKSVIRTSEYEIREFDQMFSRKDQRFTCGKRLTKKGQISKFFKSKKDTKLDALYSAELKYLGALLMKNNNNLFISECGIASELYLKSLLRSKEVTHSLKELFLKLDNKIKSMIIRKVNSILKLELTKNEFLNILSKKEIDNAFSEYRYLYEKEANKEDIDFINALTQALHSISSNKIKYRSPYYEDIEKILNPEEQSEKKNN